MLQLLKKHFGYDAFRHPQEEIINTVLAGNDALVLMPTGGGKSLCYQLPALALPGITLVISPLIALMKDQVDALTMNKISAAFLNSSLSPNEQRDVMQRAEAGDIKILYLAPERLASYGFSEFLSSLNVSLLAIDEAHCISEWGHDFRPDYRNLSRLRKTLANVPVIALTATATREVRTDILNQLGMTGSAAFASSFNRPNLRYAVEPKLDSKERLKELLRENEGGSTIVYCFSRRDTEELAEELTRSGFAALPYHAGLTNIQRMRTQEKFICGNVKIIVATIAFGMGIDKPDVRLVVHMDLPKSVEGYYQETGRAGRDGLPSACVLFFSYADKRKQEFFIGRIEDETEKALARQKLEYVMGYGQLDSCRRAYLLAYFGETFGDDICGNCDNCLSDTVERVDATAIAQKILSAVLRTGERFGAAHVCDVLRGSKKKRIVELRHDALSVHGIARDVSEPALRAYVQELEKRGYLQKNDGEYPTLRVSQEGRRALLAGDAIMLSHVQERRTKESAKSVKPLKAKGETITATKALLEERCSLEEMARRRGLAPGTVLQHIERLIESGDAPSIDHLRPDASTFSIIKKAFAGSEDRFLGPIYRKLGERYTYDEIRLARLFL